MGRQLCVQYIQTILWHRRIMDAHRTCSIWLGVGDGKMQSFRLVAYSESTADVRAFTAHTNVFSCALTGDLVYYATCTHLQFYDDQNVTKINASRFEREGCPQSCYQNYTLTGTELPCTLTKAPDTHTGSIQVLL